MLESLLFCISCLSASSQWHNVFCYTDIISLFKSLFCEGKYTLHELLSFQCWVLYRPTDRATNVARLDTRAPGSLRHAARLKTSWPGQWLCYLAAVVSIGEYMVSNKEGLPCNCHDCGQLWALCPHALYFVGGPTAPPLLFCCLCQLLTEGHDCVTFLTQVYPIYYA